AMSGWHPAGICLKDCMQLAAQIEQGVHVAAVGEHSREFPALPPNDHDGLARALNFSAPRAALVPHVDARAPNNNSDLVVERDGDPGDQCSGTDPDRRLW